MVDGSLNQYVIEQLRQGFPPETLRTTLITAGHNPQDVDFALRLGARIAPRRIEITARTFLLIAAAVLALVLLIISAIILFKPAAKEIQMSIRIVPETVQEGSTLSVSAALTSSQSRAVPVLLEYRITEPVTRATITTRNDRVVVGDSAVLSTDITIPSGISPGEYELILSARFENTARVQTSRFTVVSARAEALEVPVTQPTEFTPIEVECPASCDDLNPATEDACEHGSCIHRLQENVCGNAKCEIGETRASCPEDCGLVRDKEALLIKAVQAAQNDAEKAAALCNSLVLPEDMDACFAAIANASKKSELCANIQDSRARDNCLWEFTNLNDFSVCSQLSNRYLLVSCTSLANLRLVQAEQPSG